MTFKQILVASIAATAALLNAGCVSYTARPLSPGDELSALSQVDLSRMELRAPAGFSSKSDEAFNLSDGLNEAEVVAIALTLEPGLQAKRAEIGEADALLISAGLWPNPEFGIGFRPGVGVGGVEVDAEMMFELLRKRERTTRASIAQAKIDQVKLEIVADEYRVVADVRTRWLAVLVAEQSVALFQDEIKLRQRALDLAKQRRELGEGTTLDVSLAELEFAELGRDSRRSQTDLQAARRELNRSMGLPSDFVLQLSASGKPLTVTVFENLSEDEIHRRLLGGRFDLKAKEATYQVAENELQLAVLKQYPKLKIGPSFSRDGEGGNFLGLGASVELPLFDQNQGEIAEKLSQRDRVRAEHRALLFQLNADAHGAFATLNEARQEIDAQDKEVLPQLVRTQALFEGAFKAKELSIAEWVTIQQRALRTRREYIEALARYRAAAIKLETATGQMLVPATPTTEPK